MAIGESRKHHWVPQCYLKGFAKPRSKNSQLYVVDAAAMRAFSTKPCNVAAARDFNRVDLDGVSPDAVESSFSSFESDVDQALGRSIAAGGVVDAEDHNLILNLIALLAVRNPGMRERMRRTEEEVWKRVLDLTLSSKERYEASFRKAAAEGAFSADEILPYETMREFFDRDEYDLQVSTTSHVQQELKLVDTVLPLLGRRSWLILRARPESGGFITSDHPVLLRWDAAAPEGRSVAPGFGQRDTDVLFPISHELAMIGSVKELPGIVEVGETQAAFFNGLIIAHADRQIYAPDDRFRYLRSDGQVRRGSDALRDLVDLQAKRPA